MTINKQLPENKHIQFTKSGGAALALAGKKLLQPGRNILLAPAYHCPAALEPFMWLGYEVLIYQVNPDLSANIDHINQLLSQHQCTHCLIINYFGFKQDNARLFSLLKDHNIRIIEDCAHSVFQLLDRAEDPALPTDAVICSLNKILPSIDGGLLYQKHASNFPMQQNQLWPELNALSYTLGITGMIKGGLKKLKIGKKANTPSPPVTDKKFRYFESGIVNKSCYKHTKFLLHYSSLKDIRAKRRANFQYLVAGMSNCNAGRPLLSHLDEYDVPYVLPFLLHNNEHFYDLRNAGIQSLRWEEIAQSDCQTSNDYRQNLVQLPCHHQLTQQQLDSIINLVNNI